MEKLLDFVRGDTFQFLATWEGSSLSEMKSQVRDSSHNLVADTVITATDIPYKYLFTVNDTSKWNIGTLYIDIQRTSNVVESSKTMTINVLRGVTE